MILTALARRRPVLVVAGAFFAAGFLAAGFFAAVDLAAVLRPLPLPEAALAASNSTACSRVIVSAVVPSGSEAFTLPCFTYRP